MRGIQQGQVKCTLEHSRN